MYESDEVLPPRPQFARKEWTDLQGVWQFAFDDADRGLREHWERAAQPFTRAIQVPFPPESPASGIGDTSFHPVVWYRRGFDLLPQYEGKRLMLHFGAVDYRASVWVNGCLVTQHEGGNTPFQADITDAVLPDQEQIVVVRAQDLPADLAQPRGKQDWQEEPHDIWYHRTTGIWQPVWLEPVNVTHITGLRWTPDLDRDRLALSMTLVRSAHTTVRVRVRLRLHDVTLVDDELLVPGTELQRDFALDLQTVTMNRTGALWSPQHPNLVDATVTLHSDGEVVDEIESYAGLRSVGIKGGRFFLNGRPYYLRLALEQGYWPQSHLAAPSVEAMRREVELAKALGFNGVRIHQKVEDPRFLYWCDRLGLMVWGETANAYVYSQTSAERLTREWLEVLARDYSHPCIVAWVPLNESWGVPDLLRAEAQRHFVQSLYHLTRALDTTRPVIGNDGWEHIRTDIVGIHDYTFSGDTIRERYGTAEAVERTINDVQPQHHFITLGHRKPEAPVMITEFGGISVRPAGRRKWFGYGTVDNDTEYAEKYRELVDAILACPTISGFCYTQLTDTGQETNGLLTEDREPKVDPQEIAAITRKPSRAVPGDLIEQLQMGTDAALAGTPAQSETTA